MCIRDRDKPGTAADAGRDRWPVTAAERAALRCGVARRLSLIHIFDLGDVAVHTVGERQNRRDADDADRPGEGRHDGAALLGHEEMCIRDRAWSACSAAWSSTFQRRSVLSLVL